MPLPLKEFELLELLLRNAGRVLTRGQLIDRVWGADYVGDTKTLDVHVKRLRSKIEPEPSDPAATSSPCAAWATSSSREPVVRGDLGHRQSPPLRGQRVPGPVNSVSLATRSRRAAPPLLRRHDFRLSTHA